MTHVLLNYPSATNGGGSIAFAYGVPLDITLPGTDAVRTYDLDGLGNWKRTVFTPEGGSSTTEVRQHNGLNQITSIKDGASAVVPFAYDGVVGASNGNLTNDGTLKYTWDALNRLVQVNSASDDTLIATYVYDALNRHIRKDVEGGDITDFNYVGWRCMEDRNPDAEGGDAPIIQYIWGRYLDELIQMKTLVDITTGAGGDTTTYDAGTYYPLQDLLYRTTATADSTGAIVEAYDFDAYGNTLIFNAAGTGSNWWADDARQSPNSLCQFLFTGQRFDAETGLYYYKRRYYSAALGRFLSKDPIGPSADLNSYRYCSSRPLTHTDSYGLLVDTIVPSLANFEIGLSNDQRTKIMAENLAKVKKQYIDSQAKPSCPEGEDIQWRTFLDPIDDLDFFSYPTSHDGTCQ